MIFNKKHSPIFFPNNLCKFRRNVRRDTQTGGMSRHISYACATCWRRLGECCDREKGLQTKIDTLTNFFHYMDARSLMLYRWLSSNLQWEAYQWRLSFFIIFQTWTNLKKSQCMGGAAFLSVLTAAIDKSYEYFDSSNPRKSTAFLYNSLSWKRIDSWWIIFKDFAHGAGVESFTAEGSWTLDSHKLRRKPQIMLLMKRPLILFQCHSKVLYFLIMITPFQGIFEVELSFAHCWW